MPIEDNKLVESVIDPTRNASRRVSLPRIGRLKFSVTAGLRSNDVQRCELQTRKSKQLNIDQTDSATVIR
jgi:hypothetical protein